MLVQRVRVLCPHEAQQDRELGSSEGVSGELVVTQTCSQKAYSLLEQAPL